MRAVLIGNYGIGNLGDEALKAYFLEAFPDVTWSVISAHPGAGEYPRLPLGFRSLAAPWWKTIGVMRRADAVVFGGGSLFTDVESVKACLLWGWHVLWARLLGRKVLLAFQGIGPFRGRWGEGIARWACRRAAFISVRDEASAKRMEHWGLSTEIVQTFDPVFSLHREEKCTGCSQDVIVLVPRFNSDATFTSRCENVLRQHPGKPVEVWLFEPGVQSERAIAGRLSATFHAPVVPCTDLAEVRRRLAHVTHMVTQRYHAGLLGFGAGCALTIVEQQPGDKLSELSTLIQSGWTREGARQRMQTGEEALRNRLCGLR